MTGSCPAASLETRLRRALEIADEKERVIVQLKSALDDRLALIGRLDGELRDLRSYVEVELQARLSRALADADAKEKIIGQLKSELDSRLELIERLDSEFGHARGELSAKESARGELERIARERVQVIEELELALRERSDFIRDLTMRLEAKCRETNEADFVARITLGVILGVQLNADAPR